MNKNILSLVLATAAFCVSVPSSAQAQTALGIQLGDPTGVSIRFTKPESSWAYEGLIAYNFDEFVTGELFLHRTQPLSDTDPITLFYGPGGYIGVGNDVFTAGVSAQAGASYNIDRFDIFGRVIPRFSLTPGTDFSFGFGIGFWYAI